MSAPEQPGINLGESIMMTQDQLAEALLAFSSVTAALRKEGRAVFASDPEASTRALTTLAEWYRDLPDAVDLDSPLLNDAVAAEVKNVVYRHAYWAGNYIETGNIRHMSQLGLGAGPEGDMVDEIQAAAFNLRWMSAAAPEAG